MDRVLVCVIGQTRSHQLTWKGFKKYVLDELQADLALAIGVDENYDYANPFWQHARYRWATREFDDYGDAFDQAQRWLCRDARIEPPDWRILLKIKHYWLGGIKGDEAHRGGAAIPLYFRWWLRHNLIRDSVLQHYDRVIVTRSDFMWTLPHPPMSILSGSNLWFPDGEYYFGLTDRHMVASSEHILDAINLMEEVLLRPQRLAAAMSPSSRWNMESVLAMHLERVGLRSKVKVFPYVMFAVRGEQDGTRGALGKFVGDVGAYVKYPREYNDARRFSAVIKTATHWRDVARQLPGLFHEVSNSSDVFAAMRFGPRQLLTYHETIIFFDPETEELRHDSMWSSPANLVLSVSGRQGYLLYIGKDGAPRMIRPPLPDQEDAAENVFPRLEIVGHEEEGWLGFGLKSGNHFLHAADNGRVILRPDLGELGRFKPADSTQWNGLSWPMKPEDRQKVVELRIFSGTVGTAGPRPNSTAPARKQQLGTGIPGLSPPHSWSLVAPRIGVWSRDSELSTGVWSHTLIEDLIILLIACASRTPPCSEQLHPP